MKKTLTIFTPTYNRAHTIVRTYESLCRQTSKDFQWLVIDDGSTDNTKGVVNQWVSENIIPINYVYKENGGLHTGYNKAIELMDTELCVCIDSDDWMPEDAVEKIITKWHEESDKKYGGLLGLDFFESGEPIGGYFSNKIKSLRIIEMNYKYHHHGDVKVVHRTDLLKKVAPMPVYTGEKNFNPIFLFHKIDIDYPLLLINDNLCFVEYQKDGMSNSMIQQYVSSPRSFSEIRKLIMSRKDAPFFLKFKHAIHYVSSQIMIKNKKWLSESTNKPLTILAAPLGLLLNIIIMYKFRHLS